MDFFNWEIFGWLAALCFGTCAVPQAWRSFKQKHSHGVSWGLLNLWLAGEIFATLYALPRMDLPLLVNHILNMIFIVVIVYYKIKGGRRDRRIEQHTGRANR